MYPLTPLDSNLLVSPSITPATTSDMTSGTTPTDQKDINLCILRQPLEHTGGKELNPPMVVFILDEGVVAGIAVLRVDFRDVILHSWFFVFSIFGNRIDSKIIMDTVLQIGHRTAYPCTAVHLCSIVRVCRCRINLLDDPHLL